MYIKTYDYIYIVLWEVGEVSLYIHTSALNMYMYTYIYISKYVL